VSALHPLAAAVLDGWNGASLDAGVLDALADGLRSIADRDELLRVTDDIFRAAAVLEDHAKAPDAAKAVADEVHHFLSGVRQRSDAGAAALDEQRREAVARLLEFTDDAEGDVMRRESEGTRREDEGDGVSVAELISRLDGPKRP